MSSVSRLESPHAVETATRAVVSWRRRPDDAVRAGLLVGELVYALDGQLSLARTPLEACDVARDLPGGFDELVETVVCAGEEPVPLTDVLLSPPVADPDKIICLGLNYRDHASEAGLEAPEVPVLFSKFRNSLCGAHDAIVLPRTSDEVDFEGELAVVIGRRAKHVAASDALDHVAGYSAFNDVTARDIQLRTSQWTAGKALDSFAPMGPGLVPADAVADPQDLWIETRVNGELMQSDSTGSMIFGVADTIAYVSSLMTLMPGDTIATGTPAGVGFKQEPARFLRAGDVVEIAIAGIGVIRNPVVAEP
jgi:2-keto-4-pentenoate hydratase/2-oxohepta-3-ene-1,7-dioic acid hydratase in catechol pathway